MMLLWYSAMLLILLHMLLSPSHPIFMSLMLVIFSAITGIVLNSLFNQWMMISILMIFLGGMMVIFLYCSFMSNEDKFILSPPSPLQMTLIISMMLFIPSTTSSSMNFNQTDISFITQKLNLQMMTFLLLYLLLSLLLAVMFTKSFKGAMSKLDF